MSSKNCGKNLHACQWERDIFLILVAIFFLLNVVQVVYINRVRVLRLLRRGADRIPVVDEDHDPIINIRD